MSVDSRSVEIQASAMKLLAGGVKSLAHRGSCFRLKHALLCEGIIWHGRFPLTPLSQIGHKLGGQSNIIPIMPIGEVNQGALDHVPRFVDDQAEAPAPTKERQPVATDVLVDPALTQAGDLSFAHVSLNT